MEEQSALFQLGKILPEFAKHQSFENTHDTVFIVLKHSPTQTPSTDGSNPGSQVLETRLDGSSRISGGSAQRYDPGVLMHPCWQTTV